MEEIFQENSNKVVQTDNTYHHVMAVALDPRTDYQEGVIRCIVSRVGDVSVSGYIDRSELHKVRKNSDGGFVIGERLQIKNETEILAKLSDKDHDFLGLEDPDIWIDEATGLLHLYFTMPFIAKSEKSKFRIPFISRYRNLTRIHLGHAVGKDLDSLVMTTPAILDKANGGAKEVSIAPLNSKGFRYNLVESSKKESDFIYSVVKVAKATDMGSPWKLGKTVFHPKEQNISWIGGHASPGPLFSEKFIDLGPGKRLGIMNGREANLRVEGQILYGIFSAGLFIYDYENGKIDWVSKEPLIRDHEARTITFASQLVEEEIGKATLYAHVDDSFVRSYELDSEKIKELIPGEFVTNLSITI